MANDSTQAGGSAEPQIYQIRLQGQLDAQWSDCFGMMRITLAANGDTLLTGPVVDQAALHGLLRNVRDLGISLLALNRLEPEQAGGRTHSCSCELCRPEA